MRRDLGIASFLFVMLASAAAASAQSAIAGIVTDTTGAVMPGVTVEASSPALIEKVRLAITDAQGNYKIVDLRPGTYNLMFTLPGFNTFRREGIELATGFTATANAELRVGGLEETVTVTGASPIVDVQNVRTQNVMSDEVLNALPTGKMSAAFIALTVGALQGGGQATRDVGGNKGEVSIGIGIHGAREQDGKRKIDGMDFNFSSGTGGGVLVTHRVNMAAMQEVVLETGGNAENETGGAQVNYVPKDGGNLFTGYGNVFYSDNHLQGSNLSDKLIARGLTALPSVKRIWDYAYGQGGRIKRDRAWFYAAARWWGGDEYQPGAYYNASLNTLFYTPDLDRPAATSSWARDVTGRVTWQVARKHRLTFSDSVLRACQCLQSLSSVVAPESAFQTTSGINHLVQSVWRYPASNRVLIEAGASLGHFPLSLPPLEGLKPDAIGVTELSTGLKYGALANGVVGSNNYGDGRNDNFNEHVSFQDVTGSHAYKTGVVLMQGFTDAEKYIQQALGYTFRDAIPVSLTEWASPLTYRARSRTFGVFAQDQWTISRVTLNYGARFDRFRGYTLPETLPAVRFVGERVFPRVDDVPKFSDVSPRVGAAYDLFGTGRTAIKASFGRYLTSQGTGIAETNHPASTTVNNVTRNWNDANANYEPDCALANPDANGECGAISNRLFGTPVINTRYADRTLVGYGVRPYSWQGSASLQHELRSGIGVNVAYFRTWYGGFTTTDNLAVAPADFDPYCITGPSDARLPNGGGEQFCGLYDVQRAKFGRVDNLVIPITNVGEQREVYNGVDVSVDARFGQGGRVNGGVSLGRQTLSNCAVVDSPQAAREGFCGVTPPWSAGSTVKVNAIYPLPWWGLQTSAVFQNLPGVPLLANYVVSNAQVAQSLGRNLANCPAAGGACTQTVSVPILRVSTMFEERQTQVDLRFMKDTTIGRARVRGTLDVFNVFNANTVLAVNTTYGPAWLRPTSVLSARFFKVGAEIRF